MANFDQLKALEDVTAFMSFIKDPDSYQKLVDEAKKVVADLKEVLGADAVISEAKKTKLKSDKEVGKALLDLDDKQEAFEQTKASFEAERKKFLAESSVKEADLGARELGIKENEAAWTDNAKKQAEETARQDKRSAMLDQRESDLNQWDLALKAKAEQIKSLVG